MRDLYAYLLLGLVAVASFLSGKLTTERDVRTRYVVIYDRPFGMKDNGFAAVVEDKVDVISENVAVIYTVVEGSSLEINFKRLEKQLDDAGKAFAKARR
jgi:hypothetical protein